MVLVPLNTNMVIVILIAITYDNQDRIVFRTQASAFPISSSHFAEYCRSTWFNMQIHGKVPA